MAEVGTISRRTFLVAGVAVGTIGFLGSDDASAATDSLSRLIKANGLGSVAYLQLNCDDEFSLTQALTIVETITQGYTLEKVGAVGNPEFVGAPKDFLVTLYYKGGLRATVSSGKSSLTALGTIRAEAGDVMMNEKRMEVFSPEGKLQESLVFESAKVGTTYNTLEYIIRALQEGKTIFPDGV